MACLLSFVYLLGPHDVERGGELVWNPYGGNGTAGCWWLYPVNCMLDIHDLARSGRE